MTGPPTSLLNRRDCASQREGTGGDGHDMQLFTASSRPQIISASAKASALSPSRKGSYHRVLGEIDGHTSAGKEEISMARIPSPPPLFSDDSWGLLLVPVVTCLALVVSALLWL